MLDTICREIKNYFVTDSDKRIGDFSIAGGVILPPLSIQEGQYYRIIGSVFNDNVYKHGEEKLTDEATFHGAVWLMRPPKEFLELVKDISDWQDKYGAVGSAAMSPYTSESFGGYSYVKSTGSSVEGTSGTNWQSVFGSRLNAYRKVKL